MRGVLIAVVLLVVPVSCGSSGSSTEPSSAALSTAVKLAGPACVQALYKLNLSVTVGQQPLSDANPLLGSAVSACPVSKANLILLTKQFIQDFKARLGSTTGP